MTKANSIAGLAVKLWQIETQQETLKKAYELYAGLFPDEGEFQFSEDTRQRVVEGLAIVASAVQDGKVVRREEAIAADVEILLDRMPLEGSEAAVLIARLRAKR